MLFEKSSGEAEGCTSVTNQVKSAVLVACSWESDGLSFTRLGFRKEKGDSASSAPTMGSFSRT